MSATETAGAIQVIAMHGWCGEASQWQAWRLCFEAEGWHWQSGERGYGAAEPAQPGWLASGGRRVVIAHSLGPHLLSPQLLAQAEAVVLLASFGRFVPPGPAGRRLSQALRAMDRQLEDSATARELLLQFLGRASAPDPVELSRPGPAQGPLGSEQLRRLRRDLELLGQTKGLPKGFPREVPVLLVEAAADAIVVPEARLMLRQELAGAEWLSLPNAGHSLLRAPVLPLVLAYLKRSLRS